MMCRRRDSNSRRSRVPRGFSQIEVIASTAMLGVVMTATMTTIAASRTRNVAEMARLQGQSLANELLSEILALPACDPELGPPTIMGLETGESNGRDRSKWDDIDDYHDLLESPPQSRAGTDLVDFALWTRQTTVEPLQSDNWRATNKTYDQVYRVTVSVSWKGRWIANAVGYKNGDQRTSSPFQGP